MSEFRVAVGKEVLVFAAAHFITYCDGGCETLHGHNYRVGVTLTGDLDPHALVYDFIALRRDMEGYLAELDHRVLLPESSSELTVARQGHEIEVLHATRRYVFPEADVVVLPLSNTTAEMIARYLGLRLVASLADRPGVVVGRLAVEVEETPGQSAFWISSVGA